MPTLTQLRHDWERASEIFERTLSAHFPGKDKWHWYRARAAVKGENCRRNDDTTLDAAMAGDAEIAAAHDEFIRLLHVFYLTRDGARGVLGGRGL